MDVLTLLRKLPGALQLEIITRYDGRFVLRTGRLMSRFAADDPRCIVASRRFTRIRLYTEFTEDRLQHYDNDDEIWENDEVYKIQPPDVTLRFSTQMLAYAKNTTTVMTVIRYQRRYDDPDDETFQYECEMYIVTDGATVFMSHELNSSMVEFERFTRTHNTGSTTFGEAIFWDE